MKNIFLILLFVTTLFSADSEEATSKLVLDSESFVLDHESAYGVTNTYSFLMAEHQIHADRCLVFYYGTKIGFVIEDYTAENGFGQEAIEHGTIIEANLGVDYQIEKYQTLSFEGVHSQNELQNQIESQITVGYQYKF